MTEPIVPREQLLVPPAHEDYVRIRDSERQVYRTSELPPDLAAELLASLDKLRAPAENVDDDDVIID